MAPAPETRSPDICLLVGGAINRQAWRDFDERIPAGGQIVFWIQASALKEVRVVVELVGVVAEGYGAQRATN
jgi:hypothetical protein